MVSLETLAAFAFVSLGMVCTPGPNMIYLISRTLTQGRMAGIISLFGVILGFVVYMIATMLGLSAIFKTVPLAYDMLKWAGAVYLLWLAWNSIKPGSDPLFHAQVLSHEPPRKLFFMGFMTNLLNPKIAVLYVSLLPQFQDPSQGSFLFQSAVLGCTQISISFLVNLLIVMTANKLAQFLGTRPVWLRIQRWLMASVLTFLAARLVYDRR